MNINAFRKGQEYAKTNGLPVLKHVLLPRVTGTEAAVHALRQRGAASDETGSEAPLDGILDLTVGYSGISPNMIPEEFYGLKSIFVDAHAPSLIHIHASYIPLDEIPMTGEGKEFAGWLADRFRQKDELLKEFYSTGRFKGKASQKVSLAPKNAVWYLLGVFCLFHAVVFALIWLIKMNK